MLAARRMMLQQQFACTAYTFRHNSFNATGSSGNVAVAAPLGVVDGDSLTAAVMAKDLGGINTPAGWTLVTSGNDGVTISWAIYTRTASSETSTTWTTAGGGTPAMGAVKLAYTDTLLVDAIGSVNTGNSSTATALSVTPGGSCEMAVLFFFGAPSVGDALITPGGVNGRAQISGGANVALTLADVQSVSAATSNYSAPSSGGSFPWVALQIAFTR